MSFLACSNRNLNAFIPGHADLNPVERKRMHEFSLIWQLFEGRLFNCNTTGPRIQDEPWFGDRAEAICNSASKSIDYFQTRYLLAENAPVRLNGLIGDQGENLRDCIVDGLSAQANQEQVVRGCGAVCFRLRNNLFHGGKAAYGFAGQRDNFSHAVRFLNTCVRELA